MVCRISRNPIEAMSPPSGLSRKGPEQAVFHDSPEAPTNTSPIRDGDEERQPEKGIKRDHRVGAGHVELAMGEVDDAHDAEDQHQADGDERHVARRIDGVDDGLQNSSTVMLRARHQPH
jgi:hypothetical protein